MSKYLTDNTSLTAVADAIRAKSGSNQTMVFPNGFVTEIGKLYGFNPLKHARSLYYMFYSDELPETLTLDFESNVISRTCEYCFNVVTGLETLTIKNLTIDNANTSYFFNGSTIESVTFVNCNISPSKCSRMFGGNALKKVNGIEFDMSNLTASSDMVYFARNLEEVRFKKNTIGVDFTVAGSSNLSDASLISIANALNPLSTNRLTSTSYTPNINTITGNNVDGEFVADANGTMTLADFITNVKGWTIT